MLRASARDHAPSRRLRAATIALVTLVVAVLAQEFAVRLALPAYDPTAHVRFNLDSRLGVPLGRPNSVQRQVLNAGDYDVNVSFNQYGLRDRRDVATGTARDVYVVGDSFAFGWGVEQSERFSDQLESLIGRRVFNIATPADLAGYERLIGEAIRLGADVRRVVVAVNMIDDIRDYAPATSPAATEPRPAVDPPFAARLLPIKSYLVANSSLYFLATSLVHGVPWLKRLMVRAGLIVALQTVLAAEPTPSEIASSADRLAALARRFDTLVVVIPSRAVWLGDGREAANRTHAAFVATLLARGVSVVDMKTVQEHGGDPMRFHFRNDAHWRSSGHRIAAEAIAAAWPDEAR